MWCTRWFLPLLLLPLPTAPPYFLLLFLFSLTMHAKPCFYCIVLLTTLFVSSCYWQPFPIDSPLTLPWSENITTFSEALNATLMPNFSQPLPTVIRAVDRCWCDLSVGGFFEPFNVSHWEYLSVRRLSQELERRKALEDDRIREESDSANNTQEKEIIANDTLNALSSNLPSTSTTKPKFWWFRRLPLSSKAFLPGEIPIPADTDIISDPDPHDAPPSSAPPPDSMSRTGLPLLRSEYDLRPFGLGMIIDLGWSR